MRGDFFEFQRTHKHLVFGNHRPQLRVVDAAIIRRVHVVPFAATFSVEKGNIDPDLGRKLRSEGPAVLAWLIEGHRRWFAQGGGLRKCAAVQRETTDYLECQSTPEMWLTERCSVDPRSTQSASSLYADFKFWKETRGESPMSQTRWGEFMASRFSKAKSHGVIVYRGIRLGEGGDTDPAIAPE